MLEVRQVAQDSLREVRDVVGGYRTADLDAELAGARSVLRSAGVECRVIGDGAHLPEPVQAALGWVVREATTNVIRHSDARTCTIGLDIERLGDTADGGAADGERRGARPAAPGGGRGSGLAGWPSGWPASAGGSTVRGAGRPLRRAGPVPAVASRSRAACGAGVERDR